MSQNSKRAYSFKEGLAMMVAKDVGIDPYLAADTGEDARSILAALRHAKTAKGPEKTKHIAVAQSELRKLNPKHHGKLINALQAKVLALQGRGGDTAVAHLEPREMVVPHAVLTPQLVQLIAAEAAKRGIDLKQLIVGSRKASINPATGSEEFGWFSDAVGDIGEWLGRGKPENLYKKADRQDSILNGSSGYIDTAANPKADGKPPWYEFSEFGADAVHKYNPEIEAEAKRTNLDPDLIRSVMYMEGSHGWYGRPAEALGVAGSYQPMNVQPEPWAKLGGAEADIIKKPVDNIRAGAELMSRIRDRLPEATPDRIATLYNNLSADNVTDYGARVQNIMKEKPWVAREPTPSYLRQWPGW